MKPYVIKQGDYLTRVAHRLGFVADEVWNHAKNAELKRTRRDPNTLKAGDILFVPDEPKKRNPYTKETTNAYVASVPRLPVTLALTFNGEPVANESYVVKGLGKDDEELTTGPDGVAKFEVDVHVREVVVELVKKKKRYRMLLGDLDPIDEASGQRMRLTNLGYYGASLVGADRYVAHNEQQLRAALRAFQQAEGLEVSGLFDTLTREALLRAHKS
jgi:hypothetical protein